MKLARNQKITLTTLILGALTWPLGLCLGSRRIQKK